MAVAVIAAVAATFPHVLASQERVEGDLGTSIRLVREVAIGADQTGPEYEFSAVAGVAVAHSGTVYVAAYEGAALQISKYDVSGHYRGAIGRVGAGPGEYRSVDGMAVVGDSVLVVYDRLNGRVPNCRPGSHAQRALSDKWFAGHLPESLLVCRAGGRECGGLGMPMAWDG